MPGTLPVMNRRAFELALRTAVALNCQIAPFTKWDRKQYYYPDLPKGYQISQYDLPFSHDGWLEISDPKGRFEPKRIGIIRAHLEEDAGKSMHDEAGRPGRQPHRPEPHRHAAVGDRQRSPTCVRRRGQGVSDRAEAAADLPGRLRLQHAGRKPAGRRQRQPAPRHARGQGRHADRRSQEHEQLPRGRAGDGVRSRAAVRGLAGDRPASWATCPSRPAAGTTRPTSPAASGTRKSRATTATSPIPTWCRCTVTRRARSRRCAQSLGELPAALRTRLEATYGITPYDSDVLVNQGRPLVDYYVELAELVGDGKLASNWVQQDVLRMLNEQKIEIDAVRAAAAGAGRAAEGRAGRRARHQPRPAKCSSRWSPRAARPPR